MRIAHPAKPEAGVVAGVIVTLALALGGCAQVQQGLDMIQPPPVNPSSPIAGYAEQVSRETFATPTFRDVPPKPTDVRPVASYKTAVVGEIAMRRELAAWRFAHPELQTDTDAWADLQRHRIPTALGTPVAATQDAESAAFAKRLREEATRSNSQP